MVQRMFQFERSVRFEDVDAAGIVFFAKYLGICHEAMEAFFGAMEGGYVHLIRDRHVGFPAVHVDVDYRAPLRYGDAVRIAMDVTKIGRSSVTLRYRFVRVADGVEVALVHHTCAVSDLLKLRAVAIPDDIRALLEAHRAENIG